MDIDTQLEQIYGAGAAEQRPRYRAALAAFSATYGDGPVDVFRAPGRVNIIGEHTDYNHGYVMPAALDKDILLLARPRSDTVVRLANLEPDFPPAEFAISQQIPTAAHGDWSNYARGAAQALSQQLGCDLAGFDALVTSAAPHGIPRGAGLSSSSALTVAMAVALAGYAGWRPAAMELARLCSDAEWYVGTRGGIMDQFIALLGQRDHALFLDCRPQADGRYATAQIPLPTTHRLLIVDSGVKHSNVRGHYNRRVAACRAGVQLLRRAHPGITHLRDVEPVAWTELAPLLPERVTLGELAVQGVDVGEIPGLTPDTALKVLPCCRHVWSENHRVLDALDALRGGDIATVGRLLNEAHASARDDYEISCPELEVLVAAANQVDGVAGARLTGAGWGGCVIAMVHEDAVDAFRDHVSAVYQEQVGHEPPIFPCRASPGAGRAMSL